MNDMPVGDLDYGSVAWDADRVRAMAGVIADRVGTREFQLDVPVLTPSADNVTVSPNAAMTGLAAPSRGSAPNSAPGPT
ncbi:hypothetical protein [Streptomyces yanii]|uniref:Uncharacterized protein n=2 Tax=Streptomyces yanii TaxID=78510 RepID=A0ABV5RQW1_9ACTN